MLGTPLKIPDCSASLGGAGASAHRAHPQTPPGKNAPRRPLPSLRPDTARYARHTARHRSVRQSDLNRPRGSLVLGIPAFTRSRHMMSLMAKWRCDRPWDFLHTSPWWPSEPTSATQWQTWGPHRSSPNLRPTATLTASLSRARLHDAIGIAIIQSAE